MPMCAVCGAHVVEGEVCALPTADAREIHAVRALERIADAQETMADRPGPVAEPA